VVMSNQLEISRSLLSRDREGRDYKSLLRNLNDLYHHDHLLDYAIKDIKAYFVALLSL
jgi:hypothetical protein